MINTVLITTSGIGERLGDLTKYTNKSLVKVGDKFAICYIIDSYANDTEFIITLGYFGNYVKDFLLLAYPNHSFKFINIDKYCGAGSSLGYSLLQTKNELQKPFIFHCCDAVTINKIDIMENQNTLYVYPSQNSNHYTNVKVNNTVVSEINKKNHHDYDFVYTGISYIHHYKEFWESLETVYELNKNNTALSDVDALKLMLSSNIDLHIKVLENWFDTGNVDSFNQINTIIRPKYKVLEKNFESLCFFEDKVIKFINDKDINAKRVLRGQYLNKFTPTLLGHSDNFISMDLIQGTLLSDSTNYNEIYNLLIWAKTFLWVNQNTKIEYRESCRKFYIDKTIKRLSQISFLSQEKNTINKLVCPDVLSMISAIPEKLVLNDEFCYFHGDFILDNIIKTDNAGVEMYKLIDWRHEFDNQTEYGDVYYDLAKLRHNIIFTNENILNKHFKIIHADNEITVDIKCNYLLMQQLENYNRFIIENNYNLTKIKLLTSLIWLNMSPLYDGELSEFLFYFGKYNLQIILQNI